MSRSHPYQTLPPDSFWENVDFEGFCNLSRPKFKIHKSDKIMTAGSCFARRVGEELPKIGLELFVTEQAHTMFKSATDGRSLEKFKKEYQYGTFSARYDNIYTARQLLQLFQRAQRSFVPVDDVWTRPDGMFVDAFRPKVHPEGYLNYLELSTAREHHLKCVYEAFKNCRVFIFTLGLTEAWVSKVDGAVYPVCPGVHAGEFDSSRYEFKNFSFLESLNNMRSFLVEFSKLNPSAKVILTVSPVPLIATATQKSILEANCHMKSKLRSVCGELEEEFPFVSYFPVYDAFMSAAFLPKRYFKDDKRTPTDDMVKKMMRLFSALYVEESTSPTTNSNPIDVTQEQDNRPRAVDKTLQDICDDVIGSDMRTQKELG